MTSNVVRLDNMFDPEAAADEWAADAEGHAELVGDITDAITSITTAANLESVRIPKLRTDPQYGAIIVTLTDTEAASKVVADMASRTFDKRRVKAAFLFNQPAATVPAVAAAAAAAPAAVAADGDGAAATAAGDDA